VKNDENSSLNTNANILSISTDWGFDMEVISNSEEDHNELEVEAGERKTFNALGVENFEDLRSFIEDRTADNTVTEDFTDGELNAFNVKLSVHKLVETAFSEYKELQWALSRGGVSRSFGLLRGFWGCLSGGSFGFRSFLGLGGFLSVDGLGGWLGFL